MSNPAGSTGTLNLKCRRILGIDFFCGTVEEAIYRMKDGGLLVVPAAPALKDLRTNAAYRDALLNADLCITDSAYMVLIWNALQHDHLSRLSGLAYLRDLLLQPDVRASGNTLWVMANEQSARLNLAWLEKAGIHVPADRVYIAPEYGCEIQDQVLIERLGRLRPQHIVVTLGGGTQERLGLHLKTNLKYRPAIHCIGAAIAFLSGDQVYIPIWADRLYLGWLVRCLSEPIRYIPRYWGARKLLPLILRYRSELPPIGA